MSPFCASTASTSVLTSVPTVGGSAKFDLDDNSMVIHYGAASNALADVRTLLINGRGPAGFGNASWDATGGICSSNAHAYGDGVNLAIGYGENSALPLGSYTTFAGQTVGSHTILIKYTRGADAD